MGRGRAYNQRKRGCGKWKSWIFSSAEDRPGERSTIERGKNMKKIKITAVRQTVYEDLMARYENPMEHACDVQVGQVWIANGWEKPEGFCQSAWDTLSPFVLALAHGGSNFYDGWMKDPRSAMLSCNDGFRPVSFYVEALDEEV
jgi:uncharacterized repeat protein (TIGR04076 family)